MRVVQQTDRSMEMVVVVHISASVSEQMVISSLSFICEDLLGLFIHIHVIPFRSVPFYSFVRSFIAFICVADVIISNDYYILKLPINSTKTHVKPFHNCNFGHFVAKYFVFYV